MANKKISALAAASTPLTGSEVVPLNQSGVTSNVTVANLTAGRAVSALSVTSLTIGATTSNNLNLQSNGTTNAILDTNGNLGVGVTPSAWGAGKALEIGKTGSGLWNSGFTADIQLIANTYYNGTNFIYANTNYATRYYQDSGVHAWLIAPSGSAGGTVSFTQAMTLDNSGNWFLGQTSTGAQNLNGCYFSLSGGTQLVLNHLSGSNSGQGYNVFCYNGTVIGSITQNGTTAVAYNTTSDRRLKTNIVDLTNSGTVIDSLKPRAFTWVADGSSDAGFIADEIQQVLPKAVTGQPNATKEEEYEVTPAVKDEQGNITTPAVMGTRTVPDYQMIDASQPELIAYLVAEVQSLRARLKAANIA